MGKDCAEGGVADGLQVGVYAAPHLQLRKLGVRNGGS